MGRSQAGPSPSYAPNQTQMLPVSEPPPPPQDVPYNSYTEVDSTYSQEHPQDHYEETINPEHHQSTYEAPHESDSVNDSANQQQFQPQNNTYNNLQFQAQNNAYSQQQFQQQNNTYNQQQLQSPLSQPPQYPPPNGQNNAVYPPQATTYPPASPQQFPPHPVNFPPSQPAVANQQQYPALPPSPHKPFSAGVQAQGFPVQRPASAANALWSSGLFDCMDDPTNALVTAFFPCVTFGQIAEIIDSGNTTCGTSGLLYGTIAFCIAMPCLISCTYRTKLRAKYDLLETPAPDWMTHCFCEWCALCQEYRELRHRGLDPEIGWQGNIVKYQNQQQQASMMAPINQTMMA